LDAEEADYSYLDVLAADGNLALERVQTGHGLFDAYFISGDENGEEMHKSKGNAIWFEDAAKKMGVDVMRWIFCSHNPASNLNFGYNVGDQTRRQFFIPIWNIYSFFTSYAIIDNWNPNKSLDINNPTNENGFNELDRWALSELNLLANKISTVSANEKKKIKGKILATGKLIGILQDTPEKWLGYGHSESLDSKTIENLIKKRNEARRNKNFALADSIRDELKTNKIEIEDTKDGTIWRSI